MTWTLLTLILLGDHTTMSTDMKFVDQPSCRKAGEQVATALAQTGPIKPIVVCIPTPGRE